MPAHRDTIASYIARRARRRADQLAPPTTDADRLRAFPRDPVGWAWEVLGMRLWSKQGEIVQAVVDHMRVSVASGHKCGKSLALAVLALWFYCTFPGARVVIMAVTDRQVNGIIWREIRQLVRIAKRRGITIPGADKMHLVASSGLTDESDLSEIRGYTAREAEAAAGTSGGHILYLIDEASAVDDKIYEAVFGNRMGGNAWLFLISNPTRAEGTFYDSHHSKRSLWHCIHIDSRESPNVTGECLQLWGKPMPGLADPTVIEEYRREWGEDSALFKIRIAGSFCASEEAKVFPIALIAEMQDRWEDTPADGRLFIGLDPAGDGDSGDESAAVPRRGQKVLDVRMRTGQSPADHLAWVLDLMTEFREPRDKRPGQRPVVCLDAGGEVGSKTFIALRDYADSHPEAFVLVAVRVSERTTWKPTIYDRVRDALYAFAREWAREGGAIPPHAKLQADLHAPEFATGMHGRLKLTPKPKLRQALGRSPDAGDAFTLACWEPLALRIREVESMRLDAPPRATVYETELLRQGGGLDPYGGGDTWRR